MSAASRKKRRQKFAAGAAVALGAVLTPEANAAVITVNSTADTEAIDAQCTLREALANANDDAATWTDCAGGSGADTIQFTLTLPATITLGSSLPITGPTVIDGPGQTDLTIDANDGSRIFEINDDDPSANIAVAIDDLTLTNGNDAQEGVPGGGAILTSEDLTLTNVTVSSNQAVAGGGVNIEGSLVPPTLTVIDSTFIQNDANYAGGILSTYANVSISGSTLTQNTSLCCGGAINQSYGDFTLTNSTVSDNDAVAAGGGIALYYTNDVTITGSTISGNYAFVGAGLYIYANQGVVTIEDTVISGNDAAITGGGLFVAHAGEAGVNIRDTEISGNTAGVSSGGLYLYDADNVNIERLRLINNTAGFYQGGGGLLDASVTMVESQISGNEAPNAGGLAIAYGTYLYLVNSTIANNTATTGSGGGLSIFQSYAAIDVSTISGNSAPDGAAGNVFVYGAALYVNNSVIANGVATVGTDLVTANSSVDVNYSLLEDTTGASYTGANNLTGVDPLLGPLQDNGGPTETLKPAPASPVIDAGDPLYALPPNDQRGFPRPINVVDMGAVEVDPGTLAIASQVYAIGEGGGFLTITVNRTGGVDGLASVDYATSSGSALANTDFTTTSGTLTWADNETGPKTFNIPILEDAIFEGAETFNVTLSNVVNATLGASAAVVTINDNDSAPTISIGDTGATEGDVGTTPATFTVTLSNPTTQTVTVDFDTVGGTALSGTDFQPLSGTLTFNPLVTSQQINVNVIGDTLDEPAEAFTVVLSDPNANATIFDGTGVGTITDNDPTPTLSIGDVTQLETNAGNTPFTFNVNLSAASGQTVTVDFATAGVSATSTVDFLPNSGTLTFNPGDTTMPVTVQVIGDVLDEANETFTVTLSTPNANATILDGSGLGTITDDDGGPALNISDFTLAEGNGGTTNFVFTVTLAPASGQTVTVDYATEDVSAIAGTDYTATAGTLTFIAGDTSETITVPVLGDTTVEPNETFNVVLENAPLASIADDTGVGTITNDDVAVTADLVVNKTVVGTGPFFAGTNAQFTIMVTNAGPGTATNVHVVDPIPAGTTFVSAVPTTGTCVGTVTVDCNVGTLANNGSATITLTVHLTTPGPVSNTASATSDVTDPTPASGTANITVTAPAEGDAIPTLSEWMLLALASALAAAAALKLKP